MNKKKPLKSIDFRGFLVRVGRLERPVSWTQTARSINWTTPGYSIFSAWYHVGKEKASFSCLWAVLWSKSVLRKFFNREISAENYCPKSFRGLAFGGMEGSSIHPNRYRKIFWIISSQFWLFSLRSDCFLPLFECAVSVYSTPHCGWSCGQKSRKMSWRALLQHTKEGFGVGASSDRIKNTVKQAKHFILTAQDLQGCKQKGERNFFAPNLFVFSRFRSVLPPL